MELSAFLWSKGHSETQLLLSVPYLYSLKSAWANSDIYLFKSADVYYQNPDGGNEMLVVWTTWHICLLKRFVCSSVAMKALRHQFICVLVFLIKSLCLHFVCNFSDKFWFCLSFFCDWLDRSAIIFLIFLGFTHVKHCTERIDCWRDCKSHVCGCSEVHGPHYIPQYDLVSPSADCPSTVFLVGDSWYVNAEELEITF